MKRTNDTEIHKITSRSRSIEYHSILISHFPPPRYQSLRLAQLLPFAIIIREKRGRFSHNFLFLSNNPFFSSLGNQNNHNELSRSFALRNERGGNERKSATAATNSLEMNRDYFYGRVWKFPEPESDGGWDVGTRQNGRPGGEGGSRSRAGLKFDSEFRVAGN